MVKWTVVARERFMVLQSTLGHDIWLIPQASGLPVTMAMAQAMADGLNALEEQKVLTAPAGGTA